MNKLFVYGTLRPSKTATHVLIKHAMYNYFNRFPYIVPIEGHGRVVGELIEVSDDDLVALDHYEGVERGLYTRETVKVLEMGDPKKAQNWKTEQAFVYVATNQLHPSTIKSGDWFSR